MKQGTRSVCLYRWLLGLYPSGFKERFAEEMLEVFRQCADQAAQEPFGYLYLWLIVLNELPMNLMREHWNRKEIMNNPTKGLVFLSGLLLLPFLVLSTIAMTGTAFGLTWNNQLGQTLVAYHLASLILFILPAISFGLILITLLQQLRQGGSGSVMSFTRANWALLGLLALAFLVLLFPLHDSGPCVKSFVSSPDVHQLTQCVRSS